MNDAQAAPGASLIPDSTDIFTITVFVLIALFAIGAIAIIVVGARRKRRRREAEQVVEERIEQAEEAPPAAAAAMPRPDPAPAPATPPTGDEPVASAAQASPARAVTVGDDPARGPVTQLKGLGPKVAARLAELGVTSVGHLAALSDADAARLDADLGPFAGRMARDRWIEQARLLAAGDRAGFEAVFGKL